MRRTRERSETEELVESLAHELCNPVFAITSLVDAMEAELGAASPCRDYAQRLHREAARLRELLAALQARAAATAARRHRRAAHSGLRRAVHL